MTHRMNPWPFISIVIPTYNRPRSLVACLQSIARLDYPQDRLEVIVVDDGSPQPVAAVIDDSRCSAGVVCYRQENAGPAAARNLGADKAKGDFLAFIDDDCAPEAGWLKVMAAQLVDTPQSLVGGRTVNGLPNNLYAMTSQIIVDMVYQHNNAQPHQAKFFATNNIIVPADTFRRLEGFNPSFRTSEDREFCDRWLYHGQRMVYVPDAVIYHSHNLKLRSFCRQHFEYGRGAYRYHKIRGRRGSGTLHGEMRFHLNIRNWLLYPIRQLGWKRSVLLSGMLLLWQGVNAAGYFAEMATRRPVDWTEG